MSFALAAGTNARAESLVCSNPFEFVCGKNGETGAARLERTKKMRENAVAYATKMALRKYGKLEDGYHTTKIYLDGYTDYIKAQKVARENTDLLRMFKEVKEYFYQAIDAEHAKGEITDDQKIDFKKRVKSTVPITGLTIELAREAAKIRGETGESRIMKEYKSMCEHDGLADNGFSYWKGSTPYIFLCPGHYVRSGDGSDRRQEFWNLIQIFAHELGHKISSSSISADVYGEYTKCLANHRFDDLVPKAEHKQAAELLRASSEPGYRVFVVGDHLHEAGADYWAEKTLIQYLKTLTSETDRAAAVRESHAWLCNTAEDGAHGSPKWRIETHLRADPDFAREFGCTAPEHARPACSLKGQSARKTF